MDRIGPSNCPACCGRECYGGGNKRCVQRDRKVSRIAGVLDSFGGIRVVVTHKRQFKHHVGTSEFLCIVPDKFVHEPIAWNDIPFVVALGHLAVEAFIKANAHTNDPNKQDAIRAWKSRQTWRDQRALDISKIVFA
jgi:hypothetical protein